ncbi:hypothetical protein F5H01DRAFT_349200 [Linnemannia elongata]|nr:hypothetical protein F5H01DRAFT_349200 [Linnemannia elongata]
MESIIEDIIMEEMIMDRTANYSLLFYILFIIPQSVIIYYFYYRLCRLSPVLFAFGFALVMFIISCHPECLLVERIRSLYAARGEANKCLSLLRQETLQGPIKTSYSCTYGSCTAILMFSRMELASQASAESHIDFLAEHVATPYFIGFSRSGDGDLDRTNIFASLVCTNSWGGIAQWIAKRQLGNSISNRT